MRLLHTADWHLGQTFYQFERSYEHQCFLDWLLETLVSEAIDALLIAGDIFDNTNPSAAAQRQLYRFLAAAKRRLPKLAIVIIAGNHDSGGRLEAPTPLLEGFDITVIGHTDRVGNLETNDTLSHKRAQAVSELLQASGIEAAMEVAGRGEREPLVPTADEIPEAANRRVEINLR